MSTRSDSSSTLLIAAFSFFAVFAPMGNVPSDTEYSIATAQALVEDGTFAIINGEHLQALSIGRDGKHYSKYGIGYALLFVPVVVMAKTISLIVPDKEEYVLQFLNSYVNTVFASVIILLFFLLYRKLGYSYSISLLAICGIAVASLLLPYSKILHAEIPTTLLLLYGIYTLGAMKSLTIRKGVILGVVTSVLLMIKPGNVPYVFVFYGFGAWMVLYRRGTLSGLLVAGSITGAAVAGLFTVNYLRFGSLFEFGYGKEQTSFTTPLLVGMKGLLFSPSKSIFLFSPLTIIALFGIRGMLKKNPQIALLTCSLSGVTILFYSKWRDWHGGWSWGPRLIVPAVLLLHLFLPEGMKVYGKRTVLRYTAIFCLITGIFICLLGSLVWYQQIQYLHQNYTTIKYSHPVIAVKLLVNKIRNRPEMYYSGDFGFKGREASFEKIFNVPVHNDSIDFSSFEKFQGLAVMWDGVRRNFGLPFTWCLPLVLLICCGFAVTKLLRFC